MEEINENYNNQDQVAAAAAAAAAALAAAAANAPQEANAPDGGMPPAPGLPGNPIDADLAPPVLSPEDQAKAALAEQIERAIAETCKRWDAQYAGKNMSLSLDDVRDLVHLKSAEHNHEAAVLSSKGCVNAMSVPLPPKCDSLHPPDLHLES